MLSEIYVGYGDPVDPKNRGRFKATTDRDCLDPETVVVHTYVSTANMSERGDQNERFYHFYEKMRWLEAFGFELCIDFGAYYYETEYGWEVKDA